ncbi:MAG TPA: hypothetical protein VFT04_00570 [Gemmatimonadales bacterium]|nr:hypothetical protein [Gemmatimonadales bacterium]
MSVKSRIGLDGFDLFIHLAITACIFATMAITGAEEELFLLLAASLAVLTVRRRLALRRAPAEQAEGDSRVEELEHRVAELEAGQYRMMEIEERLDFAERLLTRDAEARKLGQGS